MAEKKSENKKSSSKKSTSVISLNKVSFWLIVSIAILHLVAIILSAIGGNVLVTITHSLMAIAEAVMICVVGILGWRFVRNKGTAWIVLYIVVLLVVLAGIVVPLVLVL